MNQEQANQVKDLVKPCNDVLEKLGWKWEPRVGEWVLSQNKIYLISSIDISRKLERGRLFCSSEAEGTQWLRLENPIPIFHWEEIEEILKEFGWVLYDMARTVPSSKEDSLWVATLAKDKQWKDGRGTTRQEAVMKAVIELGERLNEDK